jgi:ArsR family transcriptional regulator
MANQAVVEAPEAHTIGMPVAAAAAAMLKAVADPLRLRMLFLIAGSPGGETGVNDLAALAEVSAPTVSHHLKVLKDAGVLTARRRGTWVFYRVAPGYGPAVRALLDTVVPAARDAGSAEALAAPEAGGLTDADRALTRTADELRHRFPELPAALVLTIVRESYAALARTAAVRSHLVPLAGRFAAQRLADLQTASGADRGVPQLLFVCVANAGRSQLAAALVEHYAAGRVVVRSAGSAPAGVVHASVRPLLAELGAADAFSKPLTDDAVRAADVVVTMGCGDVCPVLPGVRYEDWAVGDPSLAAPEAVAAIRDEIDRRVRALLAEIVPGLQLPDADQPRSDQPRSDQPRSDQPRSDQPRSDQEI